LTDLETSIVFIEEKQIFHDIMFLKVSKKDKW